MSTTLGPTEWYTLGKVQYEKIKMFDMDWMNKPPSFHESMVACSPFAGPVAIARDPKKLAKAKGKIKPCLHIFQSNGKFISKVEWKDITCPLIGLHWTDEMRILCIFADGSGLSYSPFGDLEVKFNLLPVKSSDRIVSVEMYSSGLVALTEQLLFIMASDIDTLRPHISLMADAHLETHQYAPTCISVLEPKFTKSGTPEVFVATAAGSIMVVGKESVQDLSVSDKLTSSSRNGEPASVALMSIAPNGMFMALFTLDGILTVLNTTFDNKILSFDTHAVGPHAVPNQMVWCGEDAVVLYWKQSGLILVGPFGSWIRFGYDPEEPLILNPELDGCRVYSTLSHDLLRRVPSAIEKIRRVGSTAPGAMLLDALEAFDQGDAKADESIRSLQIEKALNEGVEQCIEAAADDVDHVVQRQLLRAASYGRSFEIGTTSTNEDAMEDIDTEIFVTRCRDIRVLNAIRSSSVAMPLTRTEYERLTPQVAVSRLVALRHHFFALKVCEYLNISTDRVLVHWACEKVKSCRDMSDEQIVSLVRAKLESAKQVSYSEIASCAEKAGRRRLATMLLDLEEMPADQVPLLLSMGEFELGLKKSIQSADTNLMYMTLLHIERTLKSMDEFKYVLLRDEGYREGIDLMLTYYRQTKSAPAKMEALWTDANGNATIQSADHAIRLAYRSSSWESHLEKLKYGAAKYAQAKATAHAKATEEQIDLIQEQLKLESKTGHKFLGLSVCDTIQRLCIDARREPKLLPLASTIAKKFKVPDKCFYRVKINALASTRQWDVLHKFSTEKKTPPSGYKSFALACYKQGEYDQAEGYAARITQDEEKFQTFMYMELWKAALDVAIKQKDPEKLSSIRNQCNKPQIHQLVDNAAVQLGFVS